ncbi:holo-acyl-carrier-protein synthase [Coriobacterium glomerans PW2]|uniref:Holo-[acyl-carrier-protein] synthase n=1 Tax=Coriobacterium glomerans (strain ATCC 49209 / DSM 20642 / JCM 10262 / PW2) TaxID=700015 RepID=F2NAD8_CORGP|nr:holo-ACP synthase [Coriobacterium glomerans]AEB06324.1 holo-acyl-carrier-protein synthase [Coriobacterium glomerans PW2]
MKTGIGVDIVEISRMEAILKKTPSFSARVFTEEELRDCSSSARPAARFASRFAAREAVLKAMGTGFSQGIGRKDVSVSHDERGRPIVLLDGKARDIAKEQEIVEIAISLSTAGDLAIANAMAITEQARPAPHDSSSDEKELISRSFRDARSVIDELESMQQSDSVSPQGGENHEPRR